MNWPAEELEISVLAFLAAVPVPKEFNEYATGNVGKLSVPPMW